MSRGHENASADLRRNKDGIAEWKAQSTTGNNYILAWPFHGDETTGRTPDVYIRQIEISGRIEIRGLVKQASPGSRDHDELENHTKAPLLGAR